MEGGNQCQFSVAANDWVCDVTQKGADPGRHKLAGGGGGGRLLSQIIEWDRGFSGF